MSYELSYLPEAVSDMQKLDGSQRKLVRKALAKLSTNPLPKTEGGIWAVAWEQRQCKLGWILEGKASRGRPSHRIYIEKRK